MKIELKRFTSNERLSEETLAFSADVYVDGKKVGTVSNHGTGGPNDVCIPGDVGLQVQQYIKSLPPRPARPEVGIDTPLAMDEDLFFALLAEEVHKAKRDARAAQRAKKFAASAKTRGFKAFVAKLGNKSVYSELLFEAKTLGDAQAAVTKYETKYKKGCFFMDEVQP